jgi:hypothetical protein
MALDTFANLKTAVQNWINKSSISASADDFITLAEAYLNQELRTRDMQVLATGTVSANPIDLSTELTRWLRIRSLSVNVGGGDVVLNYLSHAGRMARYSDNSSGIPEFYTTIGNNLYLDPAPDSEYSYTLMYYQRLEPLSNSNTSNWLLANHPNIYLNAALSEAAIFAKDQEAAMGYIALRDRYVGMMKSADLRDKSGGTSRMISEVRAV